MFKYATLLYRPRYYSKKYCVTNESKRLSHIKVCDSKRLWGVEWMRIYWFFYGCIIRSNRHLTLIYCFLYKWQSLSSTPSGLKDALTYTWNLTAPDNAFTGKSLTLLIFLPLWAIYFHTFQYETPCNLVSKEKKRKEISAEKSFQKVCKTDR